MKVAELFYSIQGEGMLVGVPSVFIRTSGCNLRCVWCDTPYTSWEPESEDVPLGDIVDYVRRHSTGHVVITGGEPMIAPEIAPLTEALASLDQHITIETAGTVYAQVKCSLMSLSPKLANSTPWDRDEHCAQRHERLRIDLGVLKRLMNEHAYQLKFVIASPEDMSEVKSLVETLDAQSGRVVLMPEGTDAATLRDRAVWLTEIAKREGYRLTPRLHIDLYGHRRGV